MHAFDSCDQCRVLEERVDVYGQREDAAAEEYKKFAELRRKAESEMRIHVRNDAHRKKTA